MVTAATARTVASRATQGIQIPPSIHLISHGAITHTFIGVLLIPGLMLVGRFIAIRAAVDPGIAGPRSALAPWAERRQKLVDLPPPLVVFVRVMGAILGVPDLPATAPGPVTASDVEPSASWP